MMKTPTTTILNVILFLSMIFMSSSAMAQPANDHIENAINLGYGPIPFSETGVAFQDATYNGDGTPNPCGIGVAGIWYKFTATAEGITAAVMVNPNSSIVIFFEGPENASSGAELTYVDQAGNPCDGGNSATLETTPGTTYYLYMRNLSASDVLINAESAFELPENDLIENATSVNNVEDFNDQNIHFLMATFTNDNGQNGCPTEEQRGVWYKFTAQTDGQVVAGISSSPSDSAIVFYSAADENATSGTELTHVNQQTNPCDVGNMSSIIATAGVSYYIIAFTADPYADVSINLSGILGTEENTLEGFTFYPNPVTNQLNLSAKSTIDQVIIYNLMGQRVFSEKFKTPKTQLDLSYLSSGFYAMNIFSDGVSATYKLIKN